MKKSNHLVKLIIFIGGITLLTSCFPAYVAVRPLPPPVVVRPEPPHERAVWIEPEYVWSRREHAYILVPGHWAERRGEWIPGHWEDRPRGSVWISGHWR